MWPFLLTGIYSSWLQSCSLGWYKVEHGKSPVTTDVGSASAILNASKQVACPNLQSTLTCAAMSYVAQTRILYLDRSYAFVVGSMIS